MLASMTVLKGARVFDGTGADLRVEDIVIDGELFGADANGDDETIDLTGATILPGFIDSHVHVVLSSLDMMDNLARPFSYQFFLAEKNLEKTLDAGITTIRDASGADLGIQKAVDDGLIDGPALRISLIALSQTAGHGDHWLPSGNTPEVFLPHPGRPDGVVDGPDEARKRVRELVRAGRELHQGEHLGRRLLTARQPAACALHRRRTRRDRQRGGSGRRADDGARARRERHQAPPSEAGVRSIEHGTQLDEEAVALMVEHGTWLIPTLGVGDFIIERIEQGAKVAPWHLREGQGEPRVPRATRSRRQVAAGVKITMGSDSAAEMHGGNLRELKLMDAVANDPLKVLYWATGSAAELLQVDDRVGTIAPGSRPISWSSTGTRSTSPPTPATSVPCTAAGGSVRGSLRGAV